MRKRFRTLGTGWKHIQEAHPDLAENIKSDPKEVNGQWMADFGKRFEELPEVQ